MKYPEFLSFCGNTHLSPYSNGLVRHCVQASWNHWPQPPHCSIFRFHLRDDTKKTWRYLKHNEWTNECAQHLSPHKFVFVIERRLKDDVCSCQFTFCLRWNASSGVNSHRVRLLIKTRQFWEFGCFFFFKSLRVGWAERFPHERRSATQTKAVKYETHSKCIQTTGLVYICFFDWQLTWQYLNWCSKPHSYITDRRKQTQTANTVWHMSDMLHTICKKKKKATNWLRLRQDWAF